MDPDSEQDVGKMKKILIVVVFSVLLMSVLPAAADLVWAGNENAPASDCEDVEPRSYIAAGEKGWVYSVFPGFESSPEYYLNGTEFVTDSICKFRGRLWLTVRIIRYPQPGIVDFRSCHPGEMVLLDDVVPAYDTEAFMKDHADEIQEGNEPFDVCELVPFTVMRYPNASVRLYEITTKAECYPLPDGKDVLVPTGTRYTDPKGDRWVLISDDTIFRNGWINIDHPNAFAEQFGTSESPELPDRNELSGILDDVENTD